MITIVDYGMGNLGSIANMLRKVGSASVITGDPSAIARAAKLILPGVGAFDAGMLNLAQRGLIEPLRQRVVVERAPVLGICLGMQLMTRRSDEGAREGLGWMDAEALRFSAAAGLKVPHMGWNVAEPVRPSRLLDGLEGELRFYFVHSYFVRCRARSDALLVSSYGTEFDAGFERDNVMGVQFHPEKSHRFGMRLLRNFVDNVPPC